ncbi:unnamed protein product [Coffea canephora]|uniref:Uncharacterized protein n=1 Tax=Coffea canephora TaxID=49390 RepID=A0A068U8Q4_COFCA|nr:unnamed protein product [Coffea canephora]
MRDIDNGLRSIPINLPGTALNRAIKAARHIQKEIEETIRQRRIDLSGHDSSSVTDFMWHLILATDENGQSFFDKDIASNLASLLLGSYSTMQSTITSIMKYLAEFPDVYAAVHKGQNEIVDAKEPHDKLTWEDIRKMKYSWAVACEVLRISPGSGSFRETNTDFNYEGYLIPKGSKVNSFFHCTVDTHPNYHP